MRGLRGTPRRRVHDMRCPPAAPCAPPSPPLARRLRRRLQGEEWQLPTLVFPGGLLVLLDAAALCSMPTAELSEVRAAGAGCYTRGCRSVDGRLRPQLRATAALQAAAGEPVSIACHLSRVRLAWLSPIGRRYCPKCSGCRRRRRMRATCGAWLQRLPTLQRCKPRPSAAMAPQQATGSCGRAAAWRGS